MDRKFLEDLKLEKEVIDKIMDERSREVGIANTEIESLKADNTGLKAQISQRDKDITELKKGAGENADLKTQLEDLQGKYKADTKALDDKVKDVSLTAAIKLAVASTAHDPDLVASQIDKSIIKLNDDGSVTGLEEQVKGLQESKAFLFKEAAKIENGGAGPAPGGGNQSAPTTPGQLSDTALAEAFGLSTAT